jgi:hypothetical protein
MGTFSPPLASPERISDLLLGKRRQWLEETCHVKMKQRGSYKEIYLFASSNKRSNMDVSTFPLIFQKDLDENWGSVLEKRKSKKRSNEEMTPHVTPTKKPCNDIGQWNVSSVTNIRWMFSGATSYEGVRWPEALKEVKLYLNLSHQAHFSNAWLYASALFFFAFLLGIGHSALPPFGLICLLSGYWRGGGRGGGGDES